MSEIVERLKKIRSVHNGSYAKDIDAAIEALQKETCEDAISRQAVLDCAITIETDDFSGNEVLSVVDVEEIKALPSVTPTYSDEEIDKAQAVEKAYVNKMVELRVNDVLNKIRAEIEDLTYYCCEVHPRNVIDDVLEIIDKYKAEREDK